MRYTKERTDEARAYLLDRSARHAKRHGFAASGVDALASAAGVTSGSLYKHFDGKSALFAAMIRAELRRTADRFADLDRGNDTAVDDAIASYLGAWHVGHPERGCPLPALTAEVARADDTVRAAFDDGLREVHARLEALAGSAESAWALIAQTVGAVMLARAALEPALRRELLDASKAAARTLIDGGGR